MRSDVFQLADIDQNYTVVKFDTDISDVRAGRPIPQIPGMISTGNKPDLSVRSAYAIFAKEVRKKRENLKEQGLWDNEVIIEDIETDPDQP